MWLCVGFKVELVSTENITLFFFMDSIMMLGISNQVLCWGFTAQSTAKVMSSQSVTH